MTAALYALRAGNTIEIFENYVHGGQIIVSHEVENYPALPGITGADFAIKLFEQVEKLGMNMRYETINQVDLEGNPKTVTTNKGTYAAQTVIIATGSMRKTLKVKGESKFSGRGVSYCATCDGAFFKNKTTAVVGGGDVAIEDAIFLSRLCKKVYLIHRRDELRGAKSLQSRLLSMENVEVCWDTVVESIDGGDQVESLKLKNKKTGEEQTLPVDGIFIAVGISPNSEAFKGLVEMDAGGYILAGEDGKTSVPGVFAAGDVRTKKLRQIVTAVADGANCVTSAEQYLSLF